VVINQKASMVGGGRKNKKRSGTEKRARKVMSDNVSPCAKFCHGKMCPIGLTMAKFGRGGLALLDLKISKASPPNHTWRVVRRHTNRQGRGKQHKQQIQNGTAA